jgi:hypothetical protein
MRDYFRKDTFILKKSSKSHIGIVCQEGQWATIGEIKLLPSWVPLLTPQLLDS